VNAETVPTPASRARSEMVGVAAMDAIRMMG
jgi:hypothetical protein